MLASLQTYTVVQWLLLFYTYCFFGWCFESTYVSLLQHRFVNRGFVRLPLLPIYGSGALCILIFCLPYRGHYAAVFVLGIIFPTILEYITGWAMESMFKMRYWDYSKQKCNLNGYICLSSSLAWGVMSLLLVQWIHPPIGRLIERIPRVAGLVIVIVLSVAFLSDFAVSFRTAFNLRHLLEELERLRTQLDDTRVQLELARAEARDQLEEANLRQRAELLRGEIQRRMQRLNRHYLWRALLRAHPSAKSKIFQEPLQQMRSRAISFRRKAGEMAQNARDTVGDVKDEVGKRLH